MANLSLASGDRPLREADPALFGLICKEKRRQVECLELIASENFVSTAVQECLGSCLTNKYSEGFVGSRYYGGMEVIDEIETLCMQRALEAFKLNPRDWHVNVQPLSGSPANLAVFVALLNPHDRVMGLALIDGGHLTHGAYTPSRRISATSIFFESLPYHLDPKTGLIDYEGLRSTALRFRPKLIICGHSSYPRLLDYKRFRAIADEVGALLWCDMAHISGLVAAGVFESPFDLCDVVTSTTHKTLRGPRSGLIFINKTRVPNGDSKIDAAVFPGLQGGPHENRIAAVAHQLLQVQTPAWRAYVERLLQNCQTLAGGLVARGHSLVTGGTDNHLLLVDLKPLGLTGSKLQLICDAVNITLNKNSIIGDSPAIATGVRLGTAAMTTRGLGTQDFDRVADLFHAATEIAVKIQKSAKGPKLSEFQAALAGGAEAAALADLKAKVTEFARGFPMPGAPEF